MARCRSRIFSSALGLLLAVACGCEAEPGSAPKTSDGGGGSTAEPGGGASSESGGSGGAGVGGASSEPISVNVLSAECQQQEDNVLRYDCVVVTDVEAIIGVEFSEVEGTEVQRREDLVKAKEHQLTLWNMTAETEYVWTVVATSGYSLLGDPVMGSFTTLELPTEAAIVGTPSGEGSTKAVVFDYGCGNDQMAIAARNDGKVVWYQDFRTLLSDDGGPIALDGFNVTSRGSLVGNIDREAIFELAWSGEVLRYLKKGQDFDRYVHHEVFPWNNDLFVVNADTYDGGDATYIRDGLYHFDENNTLVSEWDSLAAYTPSGAGAVGGYWANQFPTAIDYAHVNSGFVDADGNYVVSLRHQSTVLKIVGDPASEQFGEILWSLVGDPSDSDFSTDLEIVSSGGETDELNFQVQHHATFTSEGTLLLFDNRRSGTSRVLEFSIDEAAQSADIIAVYNIGERCEAQSDAYVLEGGNIMAACSPKRTFHEFDRTSKEELWSLEVQCPGSAKGGMYRGVPVDLEPRY